MREGRTEEEDAEERTERDMGGRKERKGCCMNDWEGRGREGGENRMLYKGLGEMREGRKGEMGAV